MAYKDGSLQKLWESNYKESIDLAKLHKRKIFKIKNPSLGNLDSSYEQYFYKPKLK